VDASRPIRPPTGEIAPDALALAQAAGVRFALQRNRRNGPATIVVGPLEE
jgi:hypothetical protein